MKKHLLNKNWLFHIEDEEYKKTNDPGKKDELTTFGFFKAGEASGFAARKYDNAPWARIDLPHDYAVDLPYDDNARGRNGLKPINESQYGESLSLSNRSNSPTFPIVWYRKEFFLSQSGDIIEDHPPFYGSCDTPAPQEKRYFLQLDGVYRDYIIWVNGVYIDRFLCGYLRNTVDITDQLLFGETNSIAIRVDCSQYDGWWYDGGGIYRDVYLLEAKEVYCHKEDIYVHGRTDGTLSIEAKVNNSSLSPKLCKTELTVKYKNEVIHSIKSSQELKPGTSVLNESVLIENFKAWDIDSPELYELELYINSELEQRITFGFKDVRFDPEKGFFLNNRPLKIKGMCIHQDFPAVGVAMTEEMIYHRLIKLKEMGANAIRTVHNPHSEKTLDICDRLGLLVMDETRMFGSSPEALAQLESLVKRDRNHVCVFIWSLGNEEHTVQSNEWGARMARSAKRVIESLTNDPFISFGGNNGRHFEGINSQLDIRGINYIRISKKFHPDDYHSNHPNQALFCSEESSVLCTRGCYKTDIDKGVVDSYGHNCAPWGSTPEGYMKFSMNRQWFCGGFLWTGYDYRGEPAPFGDPNHRYPMGNFGIMDLCGFPKDIYYYYKAHWRDEPLLHLLPAWDFKKGEKVKVCAFTNCDEVTLYLNNKKISTQKLEKYQIPCWEMVFEPGELKIVGKKGKTLLTDIRRTNKTDALRITTEKCGEYVLATVDAVDEYSDTVNSDCTLLKIDCENAQIIGAANGDPTLKIKESFRPQKKLCQLPKLEAQEPLYQYEPAALLYETDEKDPRFEDEYRVLWGYNSQQSKEYSFSCEFYANEDYSFFDFSGIHGEACIFLDGVKIASTQKTTSVDSKRPYRFYHYIAKGNHQLKVTVNTSPSSLSALEEVYMGKLYIPRVTYPLFHGKMLLVIKKTDENKSSITVSDQSGHTSTKII